MSATIFIVEDERIVAEDIRISLEACGYTVAGIANSRDQAIQEIRRTCPNLVLMDIVLKGQGDGVETARLVRELFDIPVVYLTAHADQATLHRAKVTEPFGYILKPFEERELQSAVEMGLYRHRVEKRVEQNERWLATILGSITEGVIAADAMGVIKLANAEAERIAGWPAGEMLGCELTEVYRTRDVASGVPGEVPELTSLMEEPGKYAVRQVCLLDRRDGGTARVEHSISPICDRGQTVSGSLVVFRELPGREVPAEQMVVATHDLD